MWLNLAKAEKEVGLDMITDEAIEQMSKHLTITDKEIQDAAVEESKVRHDVMAHVHVLVKPVPQQLVLFI